LTNIKKEYIQQYENDRSSNASLSNLGTALAISWS